MSTMHTYHPRESRYSPPILFDNCPRCAEQAADPLRHCDDDTLARLWEKMVEVEYVGTGELYDTGTEAKAGAALYKIAVMVERTQPWIYPWRWPWGANFPSPAVTQAALDAKRD